MMAVDGIPVHSLEILYIIAYIIVSQTKKEGIPKPTKDVLRKAYEGCARHSRAPRPTQPLYFRNLMWSPTQTLNKPSVYRPPGCY